MPHLIVAYPKIASTDYSWVQNVRREHDRQYHIVEPHFTIVFPTIDIEEASFIAHAQRQSSNFPAFNFISRCAVIEKDAFNDLTHVFLVPDEGYSNIVKLHDRLYRGILLPQLRLDISFIPHIGIGNYIDPSQSKNLADELNIQNFELVGRIDTLDIIKIENSQVETIHQIPLS